MFIAWERTDLIHISNVTFFYNRFTTDACKKTQWEDLEYKY